MFNKATYLLTYLLMHKYKFDVCSSATNEVEFIKVFIVNDSDKFPVTVTAMFSTDVKTLKNNF